jgi:hypothetical protein
MDAGQPLPQVTKPTDRPPVDANFLMRKLLVRYGAELAEAHPWLSEHDRWLELVFSMLASSSNLPEERVRELVSQLDALGLMSIAEIGNTPDSEAWEQHCVEIATSFDIDEANAKQGLAMVRTAAQSLSSSYGGKLQRLLRICGERFLQELQDSLDLKKFDEAQTRLALTYWLQNALNIPLSLADKSMIAFAEKHGLSLDQILDAADNLGINVALVDDLVRWSQKKELSDRTEG